MRSCSRLFAQHNHGHSSNLTGPDRGFAIHDALVYMCQGQENATVFAVTCSRGGFSLIAGSVVSWRRIAAPLVAFGVAIGGKAIGTAGFVRYKVCGTTRPLAV
jgi:hypothetical protein